MPDLLLRMPDFPGLFVTCQAWFVRFGLPGLVCQVWFAEFGCDVWFAGFACKALFVKFGLHGLVCETCYF